MSAQMQQLAARADATPYKELDFYDEEDADRFAGRERDIAQVVARACTQRSLVVYGRSGLGKTSLLKAGVMPLLRRREFLPIYVRTLEEPLQDLTMAVHAHCGAGTPPDAPLRTLVKIAGEARPIIIVLDQFEEFFIRFRTRAAERANFVRELSTVINDPALDLRVVFSLREEYLAALDGFLEMLPDLFTYAYRLGPLSAFGCREAIVRPLIRDGYLYDEQLVTRLVDELAKFDFDSARLQVTCAELFEAAADAHEHERKLTEADFNHLTRQLQAPIAVSDASGAQVALLPGESSEAAVLEGIFRRYLTRKIAPIAERWPLVARLVLRVMITREATKYAITLEELRGYQFCSNEDLDQVLEQLVERKIVRPPDRDAGPPRRPNRPQWYELMHECLVPEILRWLEQDEEFKSFVLVEQLVKTYAEFYTKGSLALLDNKSLAGVRAQRTRLRLTHCQLRYLLRSAVQCGEIEDVKVWAEAVGWPEARDFVSSLLVPKSATAGAAQAAAIFADAPGDLVEKCYRLATDRNQDEEIRSAAAHSYAHLAPDSVLRGLPTSFRVWRVTKDMNDLVAEVHDSGRASKVWNWSWRRLARKLSEERKLHAYSREVGDPSSAGMFGVFAGLAWALTCGVLLALFLYAVVPERTDSTIVVMLATATLIAVVGGPIVGWRLCVAAAATAIAHGEGKWFRTVQRSGMTLFVLWVALNILRAVLADGTWLFSDQLLDVAAIAPFTIVPAWIMRIALAATAQFVIPLVWPDRSPAVILSLAAICAIVLWVLIPGVFLLPLLDWIASTSGSDDSMYVFLSAMFVLALMSLLTLVHAAVLARRSHPKVESSPGRSRVWRSVVLGVAFVGAAIFLGVYLTPRTVDVALKPGEPRRLTNLFNHWPERVRVRPKGVHAPTLMALVDSPEMRWSFIASDTHDHVQVNEESYLFAPSGTAELSMSNLFEVLQSDAQSLSINEARFSGCHVEKLVEGRALQLCPLQRVGAGWSATLTGRIPDSGGNGARYHRLVFPDAHFFVAGPHRSVTLADIEGGDDLVKGAFTRDGLFVTSGDTRSLTDRNSASYLFLPTRRDGNNLVWQVGLTISAQPRTTEVEPSQAYIVVGVQEENSTKPLYEKIPATRPR